MRTVLMLLLMPFAVMAAAQTESARLDSLLSSLYPGGKPGAAVAVVKKGHVVFRKGYGITDVASQAAITPSTNFNICSMTKQFTAYAVLQVERAGKLSLDDPIRRFFPAFTPRIADAVTVRHLLTHSSGIMEHYDYVDRTKYKEFWDKDVADVLQNVDTVNFAAGSQYRYSNAAFCLLSQIIERTTGESFPDYLWRHVLAPIGMTNSKVIQPSFTITNRAMGYAADADTFRLADAGQSLFFSTMGDGGLYTSIDDYLQWILAIQERRSLDTPLVGMARTAQFPIDKERALAYGFGWFVAGTGGRQVIYHTGSNGGFRTIVFTKPSEGYAVVIFSNRTGIDLEDLVRPINAIYGVDDAAFVKLETLIN
jgi:D-alanyl-D-alanine carboxypeptidase